MQDSIPRLTVEFTYTYMKNIHVHVHTCTCIYSTIHASTFLLCTLYNACMMYMYIHVHCVYNVFTCAQTFAYDVYVRIYILCVCLGECTCMYMYVHVYVYLCVH